VTLDIFDVTGRRVRNLVNRTLAAGETRVTWDGRGDDGRVTGAGIYFYRIATGDTVETHKLVRTR
jgi:flagellar hook assembly protein FlgD